ncbi:SDR family oxidoreductase [Pseudohaliea sp.]|uniref:SDR family NAD(P)-dependent oxidoreductase n=1 Tax=Pseudohaliea sp. TaxID=2740289 RepID=UPI0032EF8F8C
MSGVVEHFDLTGKKAAVVAADAPGGAAVARAFAEAGAELALIIAHHSDVTEALRADLESQGIRVHIVLADLADPGGVREAVCAGAEQLGRLDILAGCSDLFFAKPLASTSDLETTRVMAANFGAQFAALKAAAEAMEAAGGGKVLLLTHVLGERGVANTAAYAASQAATQSLVRSLSRELGAKNITINAISLGWMDWMDERLATGSGSGASPIGFSLLKRAGTADDLGPLAVWLTASGSDFVTGQIFRLDGGLAQHR